MSGLETIALIAGLAGAGVSAAGTIAAGNAQKSAADYQAAQMEQQAADERAGAQRSAMDEGRKKQLALSRVQSLSAASGLGATDASVLDIMGGIDKYGTYRENVIRYGGESRAGGLNASAAGARVSGDAARVGSYFDAGSTILGSASTMYGKYAGKPSVQPGGRYG